LIPTSAFGNMGVENLAGVERTQLLGTFFIFCCHEGSL
jgi:hypothetical protein